MPTVLVTGSCQGLGFEFCRQYAAAGWEVLATCLAPDTANTLAQLAAQFPRVTVLALDVADFAAIDRLAESLTETAIDLLLCNAGVNPDNSGPGFGSLDYGAWREVLTINTLAPVKLVETFLPHLKRGRRRQVAVISSCMSSIANNQSGGYITYRVSKTALNASMRSVAVDLQPHGISVLLLHPGWVRTSMGGPDAPLSPEESITGLRRVIESASPAQSGRLFDFEGKEMPW